MLRNKIIYLCLLAYSVVFSVLYNEYVTLVLLIILLCLPALLLCMLFLTIPFLSVEALEEISAADKGEPFPVAFLFKNRSWFPVVQAKVTLYYYNRFGYGKTKEKITVFADARSEQTVRCRLEAPYCGNVSVECDSVRVYDYFRIFSLKKKIKKQITITIYPEIREIPVKLPPRVKESDVESDVFSKKKPGDDVSEVFNIREYREGDRIHRIHWKLSSKKSQYMVKEYSLPECCYTVILLDFYYKGRKEAVFEFMDRLLEKAVSLSYTLLFYEYVHYIAWYDRESGIIQRRRVQDVEEIYLLAGELFNVKLYETPERFPEAYAQIYGKENSLYLYYIGAAGDLGFKQCGLFPEVVDIYEEK